MRFCVISDMHGYLPAIEKCDVVLICGDIFPLEIQRKMDLCSKWYKNEFTEWAYNVDCENVIFISGNHDFYFERMENEVLEWNMTHNKLVYIKDFAYQYHDLKIYGTPYCSQLYNWAFSQSEVVTEEKYDMIPDCDILMTHQPPKFLKIGCSYPFAPFERDFGNNYLTSVIMKHNIRYLFCGHIHTGDHNMNPLVNDNNNVIEMYNVSLKNESYNVAYKPLYKEINKQ